MDSRTVTAIDNQALSGFVEEIEHQFDERKIVTETLRGIYERAKAAGFVPEFLRQIVKERQMEAEDRRARYRTLDEYRRALGMLADLPLGEAAIRSANIAATEASRDARGKPKPFAEQPVHHPKRGRAPRKVLFDAEHPQGTA